MATLKISDLSVGDWVRYDDRICQIAEIHQLSYNYGSKEIISFPHVTLCYEDDMPTYQESVPFKDIHPIPITAEILEKNGWSNDGMYATLRIDEHRHLEYYYHEHRLRKWYCGVDEWQNHAKVNDITFAAHCYSVHQLQHALRLAGVDKEINLSVMATDYTKCSIGFALGNAFDNLTTALSFFGNLLDYMRLHTPLKRMRLPQRRTIGKEHRGYAKSRLRIHQRRG